MGMKDLTVVGAERGSDARETRAYSHAMSGLSFGDEVFRRQRGHDPLNGRTGEAHFLGDLPEAQALGPAFEGAKDTRGSRDHLDAKPRRLLVFACCQ